MFYDDDHKLIVEGDALHNASVSLHNANKLIEEGNAFRTALLADNRHLLAKLSTLHDLVYKVNWDNVRSQLNPADTGPLLDAAVLIGLPENRVRGMRSWSAEVTLHLAATIAVEAHSQDDAEEKIEEIIERLRGEIETPPVVRLADDVTINSTWFDDNYTTREAN